MDSLSLVLEHLIFCVLSFIRFKFGWFLNGKHKTHDLEIVYESENYIVVNKGFDVLMNTTVQSGNSQTTLQDQLHNRFPHVANPKLGNEFHFSHRLDYATSGLVCISVHKSAAQSLAKCFTTKQVNKYYVALLRGHLLTNLITIELGIGPDLREGWENIRMATCDQPFVGKCRTAQTKVYVLERGLYGGSPTTKVLLKPLTGRRHQLRVHCCHIGHPIVGDYTYSDRQDTQPHRMFLHALQLTFSCVLETVHVCTPDPFTTSQVSLWKPTNFISSVSDAILLSDFRDVSER